jgi:penicillin-binding protein 2
MHRDLARLCGLSASQLADRMQGVDERVSRMAQRVNERRQAQAVEEQVEALPEDASWWQRTAAWFTRTMSGQGETRAPPPITVAEELDYHVLCTGLSLEAVAEIEGHPDRYLGVRIVQQVRRNYEGGALAANVLGHLGIVTADEIKNDDEDRYTPTDRTGRMGVERQYESLLHGRPGTIIEQTDRTGRLLARDELSPAEPGTDVVLSIDPQLQRLAEALIDDALRRAQRLQADDLSSTAGGAAVVLDVRHGAVYCAASGPRFDPNVMSSRDGEALAATLGHPGRPLFDRVTKMAIPPGSVFKAITAAALLEETDIDPQRSLDCRGYLRDPDRLRCMLYRHQGIGHGPTNLVQALTRSCNVYFFHHAGLMGPEPMVDWARRFGLGARTGIDAPDEVAGHVPDPTQPPSSSQAKWTLADTQALSIGQSTLATTPLQMARMMAAVANGGRLVTPRVVERIGASGIEPSSQDDGSAVDAPPTELNLSTRTLDFLCDGLEAVVADEDGTGHRTIYDPRLAIAGKTGTAETGGGRADHAWFVGYAPADRPRIAIAVAIEHAGSGAEVAGPIAKRLVLKLEQLGYFGRRPLAESASR